MHKIVLAINCGEKTCDGCGCLGFSDHLTPGEYTAPVCNAFSLDLDGCSDPNLKAYRADECLKSEVP